MSSELYQQVILDHNKKPRNFRVIEGHTHSCHGHNPLCGDDLTVYLRMDEGKLAALSFQGSGCAISKASASMMTQFMEGKTAAEAEAVASEFQRMVRGELDPEREPSHLGKLKIFKGVRDYPARVKCASLAWHAMLSAMRHEVDATTE
ncbi:MAG: SUF system NifU family Fe-S cluster assembly protein [Planctomycetes bacterium]|nr:SUF system NifU family Fe-S cluster assembly protein [Planctomycetota bacterium]